MYLSSKKFVGIANLKIASWTKKNNVLFGLIFASYILFFVGKSVPKRSNSTLPHLVLIWLSHVHSTHEYYVVPCSLHFTQSLFCN